MGQDQDDLVFIPITTAQKKVFGTDFPGTVSMITIKAQDSEILSKTEKEIRAIISDAVREKYPGFTCVITFDISFLL